MIHIPRENRHCSVVVVGDVAGAAGAAAVGGVAVVVVAVVVVDGDAWTFHAAPFAVE